MDIDLCEKLLLKDAEKEEHNGKYSRMTFSRISDKGWLERSGNGYKLHPLIAEMIYECYVKPRDDYKAHNELINAGLITSQFDRININISVMDKLPLAFIDSICKKLHKKFLDETLYSMMFLLAIEYSSKYKYSDSKRWFEILLKDNNLTIDVEYYRKNIYYSMAKIYCDMRDYKKALEYCHLALSYVHSDEEPQAVYWQIADIYHKTGEYDKALEYFNRVLEIRKNRLGVDDLDTTLLYHHIANIYISKKEYKEAFNYGNLALKAAKSAPNDNVYYIVSAYATLGYAHDKKGEYDKAIETYILALKTAETDLKRDNSITLLVADINRLMANIFFDRKDYSKAVKHYTLALEINERVQGKDHPNTIDLYRFMANTYLCVGDRDKATEYLIKAGIDMSKCKIVAERENKTIEIEVNEQQMAQVYHNRGSTAYKRRDYSAAQDLLKKALAIELKLDEEKKAAQTYHDLGIIALANQDFAGAEEYYRQSLAIKLKLGDEKGVSQTYHQMGKLAQAQCDFATVEDWYKQSIEITLKIGNEHDAAITYSNLGMIAQERKDFKASESWYKQSLAIKQKLGDERGMSVAYYALGKVAEELQDFTVSEEWYKKALSIDLKLGNDRGLISIYCSLGRVAQKRQNLDNAENWFLKMLAITSKLGDKHGMAIAMFNIGLMYDDKYGIQENNEKSVEWYTKAATLGNSSAMFNLGQKYNKGQGILQSYDKAFEWFSKAAEHGHTTAMYNLGMHYHQGDGTIQNRVKAIECWEKAAELGHADAQKIINLLKNNNDKAKMLNKVTSPQAPMIDISSNSETPISHNKQKTEESNFMIKLDNEFLNEIGLGALPDSQKQAFLQHIRQELDTRVGEKLTDGMSDEQLDEFGHFMDQNADAMFEWFNKYLPDFKNREDYQQILDANPHATVVAVMSQYGSMKWLQLNRPDYPQIVASTLEEIKAEITHNRDTLHNGSTKTNATHNAKLTWADKKAAKEKKRRLAKEKRKYKQ